MTFPKLCRTCKWSKEQENDFELRCFNPYVNSKDSWALAAKTAFAGTHCRSERELRWFAECGRKGVRWEPKVGLDIIKI